MRHFLSHQIGLRPQRRNREEMVGSVLRVWLLANQQRWVESLRPGNTQGIGGAIEMDGKLLSEACLVHQIKQFRHTADNLHRAANCMLQHSGRLHHLDAQTSPSRPANDQELYAKNLCDVFGIYTARVLHEVEELRKLHQQEISLCSSTSLMRLTVIAALYLPLSLAGNILNLQFRTRDLGFKALRLLLPDYHHLHDHIGGVQDVLRHHSAL